MKVDAPGLPAGAWVLWSFGIVSIAWRMASRRILFGTFSKFKLDDYLMALCAISLTGVVVTSNQVAENGSNYATDAEIATWSASEKVDAVWGSKMLLALEQFMLATVWLVKACLLLLYARLTSGLTEGIAVKAVSVYCVIGYAIIQILYLGVWCRPIYNYWSVPVPADQQQCMSYRHHIVTVTVLHVSSDLFMLMIPAPMIARTHLPTGRKIILCVVFSLGLLVVVIAILNRYFNLTESGYVFLIWYNAEASTAVMIANVPYCWTLLRKLFSLEAFSPSKKRSRNNTSAAAAAGGASGGVRRGSRFQSVVGGGGGGGTRRSNLGGFEFGLDPSESTERITDHDDADRDVERDAELDTGPISLRELLPRRGSGGGGSDHDDGKIEVLREDSQLGLGYDYGVGRKTKAKDKDKNKNKDKTKTAKTATTLQPWE